MSIINVAPSRKFVPWTRSEFRSGEFDLSNTRYLWARIIEFYEMNSDRNYSIVLRIFIVFSGKNGIILIGIDCKEFQDTCPELIAEDEIFRAVTRQSTNLREP